MKTVRDQFKEMCCGIACTFTIQLDNVKTEPTLQMSQKHSPQIHISSETSSFYSAQSGGLTNDTSDAS